MKHALGRSATDLAAIARSSVLLAFDFDGTLAPIVTDRRRAKMRERTRDMMLRLCTLYPCAVISGRAHEDVASRVDGIPFRHVLGNHGVHADSPLIELEAALSAVRSQVLRLRGKGVEIEDKRYSIALHYRSARDRGSAASEIARTIARLPPVMRVVPGKFVVDILPRNAPHKGVALSAIRAREGAQHAVFVGDDRTDEDAFGHDPDVHGIRVGRSRRSLARFYVRDQREVDRLLAWLAAVRG